MFPPVFALVLGALGFLSGLDPCFLCSFSMCPAPNSLTPASPSWAYSLSALAFWELLSYLFYFCGHSDLSLWRLSGLVLTPGGEFVS